MVMVLDAATPTETAAPELEGIATVIKDLEPVAPSAVDGHAERRAMAATAPHAHGPSRLPVAGLKMTVSMERFDTEIVQTARDLFVPLRAANVFVASGRPVSGVRR